MVTAITRRAVVGGTLLAAISLPLAATGASAASFTSITIEGEGLGKPLNVRNDANPELFNVLLSQVTWMASRPGQTSRPPADKLGPKYTIVVFAKDQAKQTYDLYPLATGGPRAYRPAKQPDKRTTTAAWFFGRLNMSETLRLAGVPLPLRGDTLSGGVGGGIGSTTDDAGDPASASTDELTAMFAEWRRLFLLNGVVALIIAGGLVGFVRLVRSRS